MRASDRVDLVLANSFASTPGRSSRRPLLVVSRRPSRLFLQSRSDPGRVDQIAIEPGPNDDCSTRVERMTAQELVLSCVGEKWATYENRKFVYDIGRKALVSYFSYPPY